MLNRHQKGAIFLAVSLLGSCYFLFFERTVPDSLNEGFVEIVPHAWDVKTVVLLFWISYCAILGTYLLLTDNPENPQHKD